MLIAGRRIVRRYESRLATREAVPIGTLQRVDGATGRVDGGLGNGFDQALGGLGHGGLLKRHPLRSTVKRP